MKDTGYIVLLGVAFILSLSGCPDRRGDDQLRNQGTVEMSLSVFRYGGGSHERYLKLKVTNHGAPLDLPMTCRMKFGFRVLSVDGVRVAGRPGKDCAQMSDVELPDDWSLELASGSSQEISFSLPPLDPGEYVIEAGIVSYEDEYPWAHITYVIE